MALPLCTSCQCRAMQEHATFLLQSARILHEKEIIREICFWIVTVFSGGSKKPNLLFFFFKLWSESSAKPTVGDARAQNIRYKITMHCTEKHSLFKLRLFILIVKLIVIFKLLWFWFSLFNRSDQLFWQSH